MSSDSEPAVPMDTSTSAPSTSAAVNRKNDPTIIVDPDDKNREVGSARKPGIEIDEGQKIKCITSIVNSYIKLFVSMGINAGDFNNLDVCTQLTNILFTGYSVLRQTANGTGDGIKGKAEKSGFTVNASQKKHSTTLTKVMEIVKESFKKEGLEFIKFSPKDKANWYDNGQKGDVPNHSKVLHFFKSEACTQTDICMGIDKDVKNATSTSDKGIHAVPIQSDKSVQSGFQHEIVTDNGQKGDVPDPSKVLHFFKSEACTQTDICMGIDKDVKNATSTSDKGIHAVPIQSDKSVQSGFQHEIVTVHQYGTRARGRGRGMSPMGTPRAHDGGIGQQGELHDKQHQGRPSLVDPETASALCAQAKPKGPLRGETASEQFADVTEPQGHNSKKSVRGQGSMAEFTSPFLEFFSSRSCRVGTGGTRPAWGDRRTNKSRPFVT
ncbi:unnamed protein product [Phaedon cochleariae]|uniref:Uncharacterized protein n=1 Tax=Phaedon cochleariae TaxID=80249 RepID=A0A9N9X0T5_PHACE|nr:unnamed protein product [Phaedon cochleariae]